MQISPKLSFFACLFTIPSAFATPSICESPYAQSETECEALKAWTPEAFSDPERLDELDSFRVVYHSISAAGWGNDSAPWTDSKNAKALADPRGIVGAAKLSASLISDVRPGTFYGYLGFILDVHPGNVVGTATRDLGSGPGGSLDDPEFMDRLEMRSRAADWDIRTPGEILQAKDTWYNEVVLNGRDPRTGAEIRPRAVLIRCNEPRMRKLNAMGSAEFRAYVRAHCRPWLDWVIEAIDRLRATYPTYGYRLMVNGNR